jgi:hypothetical protein
MRIKTRIVLVALVASTAIGCDHHNNGLRDKSALDVAENPKEISSSSEQKELDNEALSGNGEEQSAIENPVVREILVKDLELVGEWDGDSATAIRAVADIHINVNTEYASRGTFQVDFLIETKSQMTAVVRFANFKNGILTLDEPIDDKRGVDTDLPFSVLLAVRTDRGEFLIPAGNAAVMKTIDELKPGFAYRRISKGR